MRSTPRSSRGRWSGKSQRENLKEEEFSSTKLGGGKLLEVMNWQGWGSGDGVDVESKPGWVGQCKDE